MNSKVENLRAMFENKGESSPPDRGRSPGIPVGGSDSPRPLSKVRTSFVAVEKDGRIGLQRNSSRDSTVSARRPSEESMPSSTLRDSSVAPENDTMPARTSLKDQPIPESPRTETKPDTAAATAPMATKVNDAMKVNGTAQVKSKSSAKEVGEVKAAENPPKTATTAPVKATTKPGKPEAAKASKPQTNTMHRDKARPPAKSTTSTSTANASTPTKPKVNPASLNLSPANTGFVKPKVKSPTRPVRLPPGLTTHTAASVSKVNQPRQAGSRVTTSAPSARPAAKHTTNAGHRPSVGPPPKQPAKEHAPTRRDKDVHEGFLARMMRPTQASSSKTAEKMPTTPPRKTAAEPAAKKVVHSAEKPVKAAVAARRAKPKQGPVKEAVVSAASEVSAEDADADHAVATAVSVDGSVTGEVTMEDDVAVQEARASNRLEDAATVAEHAETVEKSVIPGKDMQGGVGHVPGTAQEDVTLEEQVQTPDTEHDLVPPEHTVKQERAEAAAKAPSTMIAEPREETCKTDSQAGADSKTGHKKSFGPSPTVNGGESHDANHDKETSAAEHADTTGKEEALGGEVATVAET